MNQRFSTLTLGLLLSLLLLAALGVATATAQPTNTLTRQRDVVVITGASLPALAGAPLDELFVYRFDGAAWQQIPFQFDEVDPLSNSYIITGDGVLDPADELAFLARDAGQPTFKMGLALGTGPGDRGGHRGSSEGAHRACRRSRAEYPHG